jgi:hypothetical protein
MWSLFFLLKSCPGIEIIIKSLFLLFLTPRVFNAFSLSLELLAIHRTAGSEET